MDVIEGLVQVLVETGVEIDPALALMRRFARDEQDARVQPRRSGLDRNRFPALHVRRSMGWIPALSPMLITGIGYSLTAMAVASRSEPMARGSAPAPVMPLSVPAEYTARLERCGDPALNGALRCSLKRGSWDGRMADADPG